MRLGAIVLTILLVGCLSPTSSPEPTRAGPTEAELAPPDPLRPDGHRALADLREFIDLAPRRYDSLFEHDAARDWLETRLVETGLEVTREAFTGAAQTPFGSAAGSNIVATKAGQTDRLLMVGAHYDTAATAYGGAYDDGTGTILAVELARAVATYDWNHTIVIGLWDLEESGLHGSAHHAQALVDGQREVTLYLNYDMTGINWPAQIGGVVDRPIDAYFGGERENEMVDLWRQAMSRAGFPADASTQQTGLGTGSSDHGSFRAADYDAGWIRGALIGSYPAYHNLDTVESMQAIVGGDADDLAAGFDAVLEASLEFLFLLDQTPSH